MSEPAYQLRPNKAVDRSIWIEAISRLEQTVGLQNYTYYGMGGAFLEDFRVLYERFEHLSLVSIEKDVEVLNRQLFHNPCKTLDLKHEDIIKFVNRYVPNGEKGIFWLDFTDLKYANFSCFQSLLQRVEDGGLIKITLRIRARDYVAKQRSQRFLKDFEGFFPHSISALPLLQSQFAALIHGMIQVATEKALVGLTDTVFQPITSFVYSDGTPMLTFAGIVCSEQNVAEYRETFTGWDFANLDWSLPREIRVPTLSTKERLKLQAFLPGDQPSGSSLLTKLGYMVEKNKARTETALEQYSKFHRHYPYFMKAVP